MSNKNPNPESQLSLTIVKQLAEIIDSYYANLKLAVKNKSAIASEATIVLMNGKLIEEKQLAIQFLSSMLAQKIHQVALSKIISKYIGETEKNLEKLIKTAIKKNHILFFDEADALFGRRTKVKDAHDKYANQEVSYLMQRMNDYPGLIIFSTSKKITLSASDKVWGFYVIDF